MTIGTRYRNVPSAQYKVGFFVTRERERRRFVGFQRMAAFTSIEVRSGGKLPGMPVTVAIRAALEFHFEQRVFPFWNMALAAIQSRMPS